MNNRIKPEQANGFKNEGYFTITSDGKRIIHKYYIDKDSKRFIRNIEDNSAEWKIQSIPKEAHIIN